MPTKTDGQLLYEIFAMKQEITETRGKGGKMTYGPDAWLNLPPRIKHRYEEIAREFLERIR